MRINFVSVYWSTIYRSILNFHSYGLYCALGCVTIEVKRSLLVIRTWWKTIRSFFKTCPWCQSRGLRSSTVLRPRVPSPLLSTTQFIQLRIFLAFLCLVFLVNLASIDELTALKIETCSQTAWSFICVMLTVQRKREREGLEGIEKLITNNCFSSRRRTWFLLLRMFFLMSAVPESGCRWRNFMPRLVSWPSNASFHFRGTFVCESSSVSWIVK